MMTKKAERAAISARSWSVGRPGCRTCGGTGWEVVHVGRTDVARRCGCRKERSARYWAETVGIPGRFCGSELREFLEREDLSQRSRQQIQSYVRRFPEVRGTWFLVGDAECVTEAAAAVLRQIHSPLKKEIRFVDCSTVSRPKRQELFAEVERVQGGDCRDVELLAIHGLFETPNDEVQGMYLDVLHVRYLDRRPCILTCDPASYSELRAALRGQSCRFPEPVVQLIRRMGEDVEWCCMSTPGRDCAIPPDGSTRRNPVAVA